MDAETRKTLEALAGDLDAEAVGYEDGQHWRATRLRQRSAAIRAALREVDALTQQVADLDARAIPVEWVDDVEIHRGSDLGDEETIVAGPSGATWRKMSGYASADGFPRRFPTLSAALSAAKETP